jgi:hypothetical protein
MDLNTQSEYIRLIRSCKTLDQVESLEKAIGLRFKTTTPTIETVLSNQKALIQTPDYETTAEN